VRESAAGRHTSDPYRQGSPRTPCPTRISASPSGRDTSPQAEQQAGLASSTDGRRCNQNLLSNTERPITSRSDFDRSLSSTLLGARQHGAGIPPSHLCANRQALRLDSVPTPTLASPTWMGHFPATRWRLRRSPSPIRHRHEGRSNFGHASEHLGDRDPLFTGWLPCESLDSLNRHRRYRASNHEWHLLQHVSILIFLGSWPMGLSAVISAAKTAMGAGRILLLIGKWVQRVRNGSARLTHSSNRACFTDFPTRIN
jgi:hypothetical protein